MNDLIEKVILKGLELGDGMEKDAVIADEIIALCNESKWVSVESELPTKSKSKKQWQVMLKNGRQATAWFNGKDFSVGFKTFKDVTHWQTTPKPPEAEK